MTRRGPISEHPRGPRGRRGRRACLTLALAISLLWGPRTGHAQLVSVDLPPGDASSGASSGAATLTLSWSTPVRVRVERPAGELIVRVDRPLDQAGFVALAPRLSPWVGALLLGYDSLVMRLAPGVSARVRTGGQGVLIELQRQAAHPAVHPPASPPHGPSSRQRLRFLKAVLLWSTGEIARAARLLAELDRARPNDLEILAARAVVEGRLGRWRLASSHRRRARALQGLPDTGLSPVAGDPNAPEAHVEALRDTQAGAPARAGLRVAGHAFVLPGTRLRLGYELARVHDASRHAARLGARHDLRSGSWMSATAWFRPEAAGGTLRGALWDEVGVTGLSAAWREPRWELPAFASAGATRDAVGLSRSLRSWAAAGRALRGDITGRLAVDLERWRALTGDDVADVFATGSLRYTSWRGRPRLWGQYTVAWLRPLGAGAGGGPLGEVLRRSQVHALTAGAVMPLWRWLRLGGSVGYALGFGTPSTVLFDASLAWRPRAGLHATLRLSRGLSPGSLGATTEALSLVAGVVF